MSDVKASVFGGTKRYAISKGLEGGEERISNGEQSLRNDSGKDFPHH
jgi:hypothetical protein